MAQMFNYEEDRLILINQSHVFGRDPFICNTILSYDDCSRSHATIFYNNNKWYLKDKSRNGTLVNNRIVHHRVIELEINQKIQFTQRARSPWSVVNLDKPSSYLKFFRGQSFIKLNKGILLLEQNDKQKILYAKTGKQWVLENGDESVIVNDGDKIDYEDKTWKFIKNDPIEDTVDYGAILNDLTFTFEISLNYEHVEVYCFINDMKLSLGCKSQHFVWYCLAKQVEQDKLDQINSSEIGWINNEALLDLLSKELSKELDIYYLNIQVFRIRKQLAEIGLYGYPLNGIIERRKGQIRFNHSKIKIIEHAIITANN